MQPLENKSEHIDNLIHAYLSGSITREEKDLLFDWLIQHPENIVHFNQLSDIWLSSSIFQHAENFDEDAAFTRVRNRIDFVNNQFQDKQTTLDWKFYLKAAAVIIPIVMASVFLTRHVILNKPNIPDKPIVFEVPYGSKANVTLPDGSTVILNAGSKLACREGFGKTHRNLELTGEGYFSVAKNKNLPFLVHAGDLVVRALGTEFNVKAYPEDQNIEAILIHGSIQIQKNKLMDYEKSVILNPSQSLVYTKKTDHFQINIPTKTPISPKIESLPKTLSPKVEISVTKVDPVIYTTWKEGTWIIYQQELAELAKELERKYDVHVHITNKALNHIKVTGTLPNISLEQVLAAIRLISPIEYKINGKEVELIENEKLIPLYKKYYRNAETN